VVYSGFQRGDEEPWVLNMDEKGPA